MQVAPSLGERLLRGPGDKTGASAGTRRAEAKLGGSSGGSRVVARGRRGLNPIF
jgi:hypothetical protein